jgi:hypothetical protein
MVTIEQGFKNYVHDHLLARVSREMRFNQRHAYFCGFKACLNALDDVAEISDADENEGDKAWLGLHAEFERFAQAIVSGEITIHH